MLVGALVFLYLGRARRARVAGLAVETREVAELQADVANIGTTLAGLRAALEQEGRVEQALDSMPYDATALETWNRARIPPAFLKLPPLPALPLGRAAWTLAHDLHWPDAWEARHRPLAFFLGPPRTGVGSLADCARRAMWGNASYRPYPMVQVLSFLVEAYQTLPPVLFFLCEDSVVFLRIYA